MSCRPCSEAGAPYRSVARTVAASTRVPLWRAFYLSSGVAAIRPAVPRTLPIVASVRQTGNDLPEEDVAATPRGREMVGPDLGNAIPHETIWLEPISTGLSFASSDASVRGTGVVVLVSFFMISTPRAGESPQTAGLPGVEVGVFTP